MCSWDLLFYYAISFVFLVQIKGLSAADVMLTDAFYPLFKIVLQIPATVIIDRLGKRKSLMIGSLCLTLFLLILLISNTVPIVIFANFILALAFSIKNVAEPNLLYDSVTQRRGKGMFAKINEIGARNYYYLDGITSLFTGFLFVINGYIPIIISLLFTLIGILLTMRFKEIYQLQEEKIQTVKEKLINYFEQLKTAFKFIFKSKRLQAIMVFIFFFEGLMYTSYTLRESLLNELHVSPQYFAIIISCLTIISGITTVLQDKIHKKFRNKALTFMSAIYISSFIFIGLISILNMNWYVAIAIILIMYAVQYGVQGPYHTLRSKYLKSFATPEMRVKIDATAELLYSIASCMIALIASYLLQIQTAERVFLIIGVVFGIIMAMILSWMKTRFGLKPEEYKKKDIEYSQIK